MPPRNAYILRHNTIYFDGHGTSQALLVLLAYLAVFGVILGIVNWLRARARSSPLDPWLPPALERDDKANATPRLPPA